MKITTAEAREVLRVAVVAVPGLSTRELAAAIGQTQRQTLGDLGRLARDGRILRRWDGRATRWYPSRVTPCP
jgi:hypothetical protein